MWTVCVISNFDEPFEAVATTSINKAKEWMKKNWKDRIEQFKADNESLVIDSIEDTYCNANYARISFWNSAVMEWFLIETKTI